MSFTFFIDSFSKTVSFDSIPELRFYKLKLMLKIKEAKTDNRNYTQKQTAKEKGCFDSTIKRYQNDINMNSPQNSENMKNFQPSFQSWTIKEAGCASHIPFAKGSTSSKNENGEIDD